MRLQNTPPAGAGQVQRVTKTDLLLKRIEGLGTDKHSGNAIGIRTIELATAAGINPNSICVLLAPHVASGRIRVCKVTAPGRPAQNEYRKGSGVPVPEIKPLNTKRAGAAHTLVTKPLPVTTPAPALSTARAGKPTTDRIRTPVLITQTPPEVVAPPFAKTPAADVRPPMRTAPAVAAAQATPKPKAGAALTKEPAAPKASAGDVLLLSIDQEGALQIGYGDDPARWVFAPPQVLALGDFLHATQMLWRP